METPFHTVVVVGAGVSGLAAARHLLPTFPDLLLLEASARIGGRVSQVRGVLPWPVELGPEFIHGAKSSLQALLQDMGCEFREYAWPDRWYFRGERRLKPSSEEDADVNAVMDKFESVGKQDFPTQDLSAEQWLRNGGASERMIDIADACFANDFGCSISQLGMRETILENRKWDSGETYLVLDRSLSKVVQHIGNSLSAQTLLNWPLHRVELSPGSVALTSLRGERLRCRHLVLTLPLAILQRGDVLFRPPLPEHKLGALSRIKMSNAVKVIVALERPIWPEGFFDVVCPGCFIPEFWVTEYPREAEYRGPNLYGITGFACGKKAEQLSGMRESALVIATLAQLDELFGFGAPSSPDRHPATAAFVRAHVADWSKEQFIAGAYSYPSLGARIGDREALAEPVGSSLFFAGEATHPAVNPCIQAAYDTGIRVAKQVVLASKMQGSQSKL